jgi:hypothetical protein
MKIIVLVPREYIRTEAWASGLINSLRDLGHTLSILKINLVTTQELYNYDMIISYGTRDVIPKDIPCMVLDLGYFNRYTRNVNPDGYLQVCPNSLNNIAPPTVDASRNKSSVQPKPTTDDMPYLILGQKEGDKQHGMSQGQLKDYYNKIIAEVHAVEPAREIWFRNHPKSAFKHELRGISQVADEGPLEALVGRVSCVYTYNSTGALCFLLGLTKVVADESAFFHTIGLAPTKESVTKLCERLWYSQWNSTELANPEVVNTLIDYVLTGELGSTPVQKGSKPIETLTEEAPLADIDPNSHISFHKDTAAAILEEKDFSIKQAMFKQVWPQENARSKKAIHSFCNNIVNSTIGS